MQRVSGVPENRLERWTRVTKEAEMQNHLGVEREYYVSREDSFPLFFPNAHKEKPG